MLVLTLICFFADEIFRNYVLDRKEKRDLLIGLTPRRYERFGSFLMTFWGVGILICFYFLAKGSG